MNSDAPCRWTPANATRTALVVLLALLTSLTVGLTRPAAEPTPAPIPISSGAGLDWGIKASFRNYVVGGIAHGTISVADGASRNPDGTFHFPVTGGEYDPETSATVVRFGGIASFRGHDGQLEMTLSGPRVEITPDGAKLVADVRSRTLETGAPLVDYPGVLLAEIDADDATPTVADGTTTWSSLPAALSEPGAPAFAGFYLPGAELDPVSFGYDGPGGKPQREIWSTPGAPAFGVTASGTVPNGVGSIAFGRSGTIWTGSYDHTSLTRLNATTLAVTGSVDVEHQSRRVAVNRSTGRAYSVDMSVRAVTDDPTPSVVPATVGALSGATNALAVRPSDGAVLSVRQTTLSVFAPQPDGSYETTEHPLDASYDAIYATADGRVYVSGMFASPAVAEVTFAPDGTATAQPIAETSPPGTATGAYSFADDGTIAFVLYGQQKVRVLHPADGGGYTVETVADSRLGIAATALSPDGETLYVSGTDNSSVLVIRDGEVLGQVPGSAALNGVVADDHGAYAYWRSGTVSRIAVIGTSPEITEQPASPSAVLPSADGSRSVRLAVAATGDPAPAVHWQRRAAGATRWIDIPGATAAQVDVTVTSADAGTAYRAIVTNDAGALASDVVTLSVTIAPPAVDDDVPPVPHVPPGLLLPGPPSGSPATTPVAKQARATVTKRSGTRRLSRGRVASIGTVRCPAGGACTVTVPQRVTTRIAGRRYTARVTATRKLQARGSTSLRVRFTPQAARRLQGRSVVVRLKVRVRNDAGTTTKTLRVRVAGRR
jgi:hypothetical protein